MRVIDVDNVGQALPLAIAYLREHGQRRSSRNGPVIVAPEPVTTVYRKPLERVLFYPERDANPFFHIYESLWMLSGRNDVTGPSRILRSFAQYSDDGAVFHGAYGWRWRWHFEDRDGPVDQLRVIAEILRRNPDDRRAVLQMWDPSVDLWRQGKDVPCNQSAVFNVNDGKLDMTVFCRSNDILWGCYGANAVHFSVLLEYMAVAIGVPVGVMTQVSVNWHAYDNHQWKKVQPLADPDNWLESAYGFGIRAVPMPQDIEMVNRMIAAIMRRCDRIDDQLAQEDADSWVFEADDPIYTGAEGDPWYNLMDGMMYAHAIYRNGNDPEDIQGAFDAVSGDMDWGVACQQWLYRRSEQDRGR